MGGWSLRHVVRFYSDILLTEVLEVTDPCGDCVAMVQNERTCKCLRRPLWGCFVLQWGRSLWFLWLSAFTWMQEKWMHLINLSLTFNREVKNINLDMNTISNYQTPWVTCIFSYLGCKKQTKTKQRETFLFIYFTYFCFVVSIFVKVSCLWHTDWWNRTTVSVYWLKELVLLNILNIKVQW